MTRVDKVLLINVGTDATVSAIANDGSFPALGVVSLATVLLRRWPEKQVQVLDGQVTPMAELELAILAGSADIVGLSVLSASYKNSLRLANVAKQAGSIVVFGNDHAAILARQILERQEAVDYICTADVGEFAFCAFIEYLEGMRPIDSVPMLAYRTKDGIRQNDHLPEIDLARREGSAVYILDQIPIPNRRLAPQRNQDAYLVNYLSRYGSLHGNEKVTGIATMNRARGCARKKQPCTFCGIKDLSLRFSSPEIFWTDVKAAEAEVSASIIYEVFDSMSSSPKWVSQLVKAKPPNIEHLQFFVYAQAAETNTLLVEQFKKLGVFRVNMGLEAGDTAMLRRLKGAHDSLEKNQHACILFKNSNIPIYASLVLGGPGETYESLENTVRFSRWLVDNDMIAALETQPLYPDFGATAGKWLLYPDDARHASQRLGFSILDEELLQRLPEKYSNTDAIDFDEISQEWNKIFSNVGWSDLMAATAEILSYAEQRRVTTGSARVSSRELQRGLAPPGIP